MSFGVGLVLRTSSIKGRKRQTGAIDADYFGKSFERHFEASRIVDLRHKANIGQRDLATAGIGTGRDQRFQRLKAGEYRRRSARRARARGRARVRPLAKAEAADAFRRDIR